MAFDLVAAGGYGSGDLGDITDPVGTICTTAFWAPSDDDEYFDYSFLTSSKEVGIYGDFAVGMEVLITVAGMSESDTDLADRLGLWTTATIDAVEGNRIEIGNYNSSTFNQIAQSSRGGSQTTSILITSIPHFRNLTLNEGCYLTPRKYFPLAFKCSRTLTLNGGHIDLRNKGFLERAITHQEAAGTRDIDKYSGWENSQTKYRFLMNTGDGAAFIVADKLVVANNASRIGNPNFKGIQFCRGASDSRNLPTNATNIGGATILLVAGTITDFSPNIIAKYRSTAETEETGLARCYIASNTILRNDEGLYAYDCISDSSRLSASYPNIKSFGDGSSGESTLTTQLNNYAVITAIDSTRQVLTVSNKTTKGAEPLAIGRLVMIHKKSKGDKFGQDGRFLLAKILGINGDDITLDSAIPDSLVTDAFDSYNWQLISIPQFSSYTLSGTHSATPAYADGKGGIFAIAVNGTCDIRGGKINVEEKGGGKAYGRTGLAVIGNAQDAAKLPIGQGHGSVFILAKNLVMNSETRIGATYSGAISFVNANDETRFGGSSPGVRNIGSEDFRPHGGGYRGWNGDATTGEGLSLWSGRGGGGDDGGEGNSTSSGNSRGGKGGYGSNGSYPYGAPSCQGAHIMIIADTITGFNQAAISTGGAGGNKTDRAIGGLKGLHGSAGYGGSGGGGYGNPGGGGYNSGEGYASGAGGYNGGGGGSDSSGNYSGGSGGSSGWAFIYCNHAIDQNTTDTVYF